MAINLTTNGAFVGRHTAADANYPYGSAKNETALGANDGSPYLKVRADDVIGLQQALLNSAAIVPSGSADTVVTSQYMEAITEIVMGRAVVATEGVSAANAYVVEATANQHPPKALFDGMAFKFKPVAANTATATINAFGLGVKTITGSATAGYITANVMLEFQYNAVSDQWELKSGILANQVTLGMLAQVATDTFLGRWGTGTGDVQSFSTTTAASMLLEHAEAAWEAGVDTQPSTVPPSFVAAAIAALAPKLIESTVQAATSGTAIDFTGIPAGTKEIEICMQGVSTGGVSSLLVQIGDSGGVETTGYISGSFHGITIRSSTAGFVVLYNSAVSAFDGVMRLVLMEGSTNAWVAQHGGTLSTLAVAGGGGNLLSAELTQLRLTTVSGDTFDLGNVNILYR